MSNLSIQANGLGKYFKIYPSAKHRLFELLPMVAEKHTKFTAVRDVNLSVEKGEVLGIIGLNGGGKSTLLQLIVGVLTPSFGEVKVSGRIGAILQLGSGFNPEFTGRENAVLSLVMNGFSRAQAIQRLNHLKEFSGLGNHFLQPVKTYSSGMFVRLAFACALEMDPDILVVDEALAVGDAKFQKKCYAKFEDLKRGGKTIILVSHDLEAIKALCSRAIYMKAGEIAFDGEPKEAILKYYQDIFPLQRSVPEEKQMAFGLGGASFSLKSFEGPTSGCVKPGDHIRLSVDLFWDVERVRILADSENVEKNLIMGIHLETLKGLTVFGLNSFIEGQLIDPENGNHVQLQLEFDFPHINTGDYFLTCAVALGSHTNHVQLCWDDAWKQIRVDSPTAFPLGVISVPHNFKIKRSASDAKPEHVEQSSPSSI